MRRLLAILILLAGSLWAQCPATDSRVWQGTYTSGTTYALNDTLYYAGSAYTSLQASNTGHQPDISVTWWVLVYSSPVNIQPTDCRVGSHIALDYNLAWLRANSTGGAVSTVFGRAGTVAAQTGDYTAAQVTNAVDSTGSYSNPSWITALAWSKITGVPTFLTPANNLSDLANAATARANLGVFANPMTSAGDLIIGGASGVPQRLANPGNGTFCPSWSTGVLTFVTCPGAGGGISSIGLTVPSWLSVTGSPLTVNGTIAVTAAAAQTSHQVIGTCGTATTFGPCALLATDMPAIPESGVTGLVADLAGKQPTITGGTQDQVITGTFGLLGLADCTSTGGIWRYSTTTHASSCHTIVVTDLPTGTTSSTVAIGNDTRFPASVTGLRKGAGAGSADTAATAADIPDLSGTYMAIASYATSGSGAPSGACSNAGAFYRDTSTTPVNVYICSGSAWAGPFTLYDGTKSGSVTLSGITSGVVALAAADVAGTAIAYVLPATNGTANQALIDTGSTTCPTLAAGAPTTCHQLSWTSMFAPLASPTLTGTVTMPAPTFNTITGSTQCLHVSTLGVVSGTGSDCGSGGSGANALGTYWTASSTNAPANAVNLGALSTGLVKITVSGAVATPSTATSADLPVPAITRTSCFDFGTDNASSDLVDADIGPQGRIFMVPVAGTVIEVTVSANAGTPSVILQKNHTGTATDLVSAQLATAASGAVACAATGSACLDGTAKSGTVTIVTAASANVLAAGDWIQTKTGSGFASTGAKRLSACVTYTVN